MGLLEFVKDAGAKIFDWGKEDREKSAKLAKVIQDMGLHCEGLEVVCDDDKVTLKGRVPSQEEREKIVLLVGNSEGVAKVEDQFTVSAESPAEAAKAGSKFHTVVRGDTLSKIAQTYYGDINKYQLIFEANKPMLADPNKIFPGQVLRIPTLN